MNYKKLILILICGIFLLKNEAAAQTAKCVYIAEYFGTTELKTLSSPFYKCDLITKQANYNEKLTKIDGQHGNEHSDEDVRWISNDFENQLKIFSPIFCQKFPNLEVIDINDAELESIDEESLSNCKNLNHLGLYKNKLRELSENLLIQNSKLTYFWISANRLTTLAENFFLNQQELVHLDMSDNQIKYLPRNIFRPLVKLEELFLFINNIGSIDPEWFKHSQNLKLLALNENRISEIPSKCFAFLRNLEKLWLDENRIETLKSDSFDGLQNLEYLALHNNKISDLPACVFTPLKNLKELYLEENKLLTIHSDFFDIHNQLLQVHLQNNKIFFVDPNFLDNTEFSLVDMTNNICCQEMIGTKYEMYSSLWNCFVNYELLHFNRTPCLSRKICGKPPGNINGGTQIKTGDYPWNADLMTQANKFFCGGTLISKNRVITAAHCILKKKSIRSLSAVDLYVLLGSQFGRVFHTVNKIHIHPDWNHLSQSYDADIAVLILVNRVIFNEHVHPICLPTPNSNIATISTGMVIGYGKIEDEIKALKNTLRILAVPIHKNDDCFRSNDDLISLSSERTFCGGSGNGVSLCSGDSGSGLIVSDGNTFYLRGVVSFSCRHL